MDQKNNSVTVFNTNKKSIPAFSAVMLTGRADTPGVSDDICFSVAPAVENTSNVIGISAWEIPPSMPGKVVISGVTPAEIADFFSPGDRISPAGSLSWKIDEAGQVSVISPAGSNGIGVVMLGSAAAPANFRYDGFFAVEDTSSSEKLSFLAHGGETDIGYCSEREFNITSGAILYLLAEYHSSTQKYSLKLTISPDSERTSKEYTLWKIATINVSELKTLEIQQHWTGGIIYFGSRFWI